MSPSSPETSVLRFDRLLPVIRFPQKYLEYTHQLNGCWLQLEFLESDESSPRTFDDKLHLSKLLFRHYIRQFEILPSF
jgi:hypothetical protein